MAKFIYNFLDIFFIILKVFILLGVVGVLSMILTFFLMIFLPEQTQQAIQIFSQLF